MFDFIDLIGNAPAIAVLKDGAAAEYGRGGKEYSLIMDAWHAMTENAHPMPAFGVCIDALTRQEKQSGTWLEFVFSETQSGGGLPFDKLLLKVNPEYRGINLCRHYEGIYGGRCFYLDLGKGDMTVLADTIDAIAGAGK